MTPGHSPDGVSLVLDSGAAFTGDLAPEIQMMEDDVSGRESWQRIDALGARTIYPAHGPVYVREKSGWKN